MEEKKLGFLIANLFNDYTNYMNSYLKEMDLTFIGKSSVTKSVKILEKKGFLTKEIDPEDNRRKIVKITKKGKEIQKAALQINNEIEESIISKIGENEIKTLKEQLITLDELIKN